jgi:putative transposase
MAVITEHKASLGVAPVCEALVVPRASYYRWQHPCVEAETPKPRRRVPRALPPEERQQVLAILNDERFADLAPAEVYATLLDEGQYLCSIRTMYRILQAHGELKERRRQVRHPHYQAPELLATRPNQLWSWDISAPQQAASEMRVDPSQSACRSRLQTTASGSGQKPRS